MTHRGQTASSDRLAAENQMTFMKNLPCGTAQFGARAAYLFWLAAGADLLAACAHHHPAPTESYSRIYGQPLVSPGTKFAALPPAIQHTIRAEAGQAEIADINK